MEKLVQLCALSAAAAAFTTPTAPRATPALRSTYLNQGFVESVKAGPNGSPFNANYADVDRSEVQLAAQTTMNALRSKGRIIDKTTEEAAWEAAWIAASVANQERLKNNREAAAQVAYGVQVPPVGGSKEGTAEAFVADKPAFQAALRSSGRGFDQETEEAAWEAAWIAASVANLQRLKLKQDAAAQVAYNVQGNMPPLGAGAMQMLQQPLQQQPMLQQPMQPPPMLQQPMQPPPMLQQPMQQQPMQPMQQQQMYPQQMHPEQVHPQQMMNPQPMRPQQMHPEQMRQEQMHQEQMHQQMMHEEQMHQQMQAQQYGGSSIGGSAWGNSVVPRNEPGVSNAAASGRRARSQQRDGEQRFLPGPGGYEGPGGYGGPGGPGGYEGPGGYGGPGGIPRNDFGGGVGRAAPRAFGSGAAGRAAALQAAREAAASPRIGDVNGAARSGGALRAAMVRDYHDGLV
jgi:hypothetical protein